jgi:hypothetical protein
MTSLVPSQTGLEDLVAHALNHLESLGYAARTLANYRNVYEAFLRFAEQEAETEDLSTALVQRFLEHHEIPADWTESQLTFRQRHVRTVMRVLREFALHGCFQRRSHIVGETKLAPPLQRLLCGYEEFVSSNWIQAHFAQAVVIVTRRDKLAAGLPTIIMRP